MALSNVFKIRLLTFKQFQRSRDYELETGGYLNVPLSFQLLRLDDVVEAGAA